MTKKNEEELSAIPNEKYEKFFAKFAEVDTLEIAQWKVAHLLGYFCRKWKDHYGTDYHWKYNNQNPNKCFEVWQMSTLVAKLSANPKILKEYIDWVFTNIVPKKSKLRSISFMTNDDVVIPYKMNVLLSDKKDLHVDRSTPLPTSYQDILKNSFLNTDIKTYGDLAFLHSMHCYDPGAERYPEWMEVMQKLIDLGMDPQIMSRIV